MGYLDYAGLQYLWGKLKEKFAPKSHSHDDRYYTESEMDGKLSGKADNTWAGANDLINKLDSGTAAPVDDDLIITQWANHTTAAAANKNQYVRRPMSSIWSYIKSKADAVYSAKSHTHTKSQITDFPVSLKNPTALTIQANGTTAATYDGSAAKTVNITKSNIGLGNVDNTADANKSVNYANSAGNATNATNATSATNAANATTATKLSSNAGSNNQPVYFSGGKPVAIGYTIAKSVPADAKFTDTNTWRGIQNNLTSDSTDQSLSAAQGKALKTLVDGKAPASHKHTKSQITDFPTSMPASDVSAWAKAATKPSYTKAEVGLGNVDNTADKDKSVKYATSAGSATTGLNGVSTCIFDLSSNNGSCVRFYNGLQICFGNSSKNSGVVFKLPFANDNYAVVVGGSDTLKNAWYVAGGRTTTGFNPNQNGFAVLFHWIAIGNWK